MKMKLAEAKVLELEPGADTNYPLKLVDASVGVITDGYINMLQLDEGKRVSIDVELEQEFEGTIRMVANAI
jgi:hypothetical protein